MASREFDVIVWGATGFVGQLVTEYLVEKYTNTDVKFAIAGRNAEKLGKLIDDIAVSHPAARNVKIITGDLDSMNAVVKRAKAVIALAGPFAKIGEPVVKACVEEGTNYVDITGEVNWGRRMIDTYGEAAKAKGVKIVNYCGFDSVPFDMSAFALQREAKLKLSKPLTSVHCMLTDVWGGISGGTVHSIVGVFAESKPKELLELVNDNYLADRDGLVQVGSQSEKVDMPFYSKFFNAYSSRFFMTPCNGKVVRRSASLLPSLYAPDAKQGAVVSSPGAEAAATNWFGFEYREGMKTPNVLTNAIVTTALTLSPLLLMIPPIRTIVGWLFPQGSGPSREAQVKGRFTVEGAGYEVPIKDGQDSHLPVLKSRFHGKGDPGYLMTARMVCEAGICAAQIGTRGESTPNKLPLVGGVTTAAAALGEEYLERLKAAGFEIDVQRVERRQ